MLILVGTNTKSSRYLNGLKFCEILVPKSLCRSHGSFFGFLLLLLLIINIIFFFLYIVSVSNFCYVNVPFADFLSSRHVLGFTLDNIFIWENKILSGEAESIFGACNSNPKPGILLSTLLLWWMKCKHLSFIL